MTQGFTRRTVVKGAAATAAVGTAGIGFPAILKAADVVKVGLTIPITGLEAILGESMINCYTIAADELNEAGGIGGREVELIVEDNQTSTKGCIDKARKMIGQDEVDVLMGGVLSLERQATMTVSVPAGTLYLYPTYYEGGECENYLVCTGQVPNQQVEPYVPYLVEKYGQTVYVVASDYIWPRVSTELLGATLEKHGGSIVGADFYPFGTQDFGPSFQKIKQAAPDMVWIMTVGNDGIASIKQYRSFGLPHALVSHAYDELFARLAFPQGEITGMESCQSYFMTLDTPENTAFMKAFRAKFGEDKLVDSISEAGYCSLRLYALAVEKAGSTDPDKVIPALSQVEFVAPQGPVRIDGSNNHMVCNSMIGQFREDGYANIVKQFGQIDPIVEGCSLG